jgi:hypothetical protein
MTPESTAAHVFFYVNDQLAGGCLVTKSGKPTQLALSLRTSFYGDVALICGLEDVKPGHGCQQANGIADLGAQVIAELKQFDPVGGVYLAGTWPEDGEFRPWTYVFRQVLTPTESFMGLPGELAFEVYRHGNFVYGGSFAEADFEALEKAAAA